LEWDCPRNSICYCRKLRSKVPRQDPAGFAKRKNWDDPTYRQWIEWNSSGGLKSWTPTTRKPRRGRRTPLPLARNDSGSLPGRALRSATSGNMPRSEFLLLDIRHVPMRQGSSRTATPASWCTAVGLDKVSSRAWLFTGSSGEQTGTGSAHVDDRGNRGGLTMVAHGRRVPRRPAYVIRRLSYWMAYQALEPRIFTYSDP